MKFAHAQRGRLQKGFSLIEIMLVLGVVAVFVGIVFMMYQKVQASSTVNTETQNISTIQAGIHSLYASQPNFTGLTNSVIISAGIPPLVTVTPPATITNSWGGMVTVAVGTIPTTFTITTDTVPTVECAAMASEISSNFRQVSINGTLVKDMTNPSMQTVNIPAVTTSCAVAANTLIFTSM